MAAYLNALESPACWKAATLRQEQDWVCELSRAEVDDLLRATEAVATQNVESITRSDFPLGKLKATLARVRRTVVAGKGLVLMRGLPVRELSEEDVGRMLWGIGQHLGIPQPQDAAGALLHHVRDTGASVAGQSNIRTFQTNEAQPWHNDGGDLFLLLCREVARNGGKSYVASTQAVFNALLERDQALARVVQEDFYFDARGQALPGHGPVQVVPIFAHHEDHMFMLHKRHYIELAQRFPDVPKLSALQRKAIDAIEEICDDPAYHLAFDLEPGDLEIANNFAVLHKRGAFDQDMERPSERHMLRLWLGLPDGWTLPECFRETREYGPLFDIREA